ncbi:MAG: cyclic nucleotide-binding domain-containing protein [Acidobacteriota bacterium]|nr:cyclic nucleotide-binding domain-containing protein [Acidobacteriota bacterium]
MRLTMPLGELFGQMPGDVLEHLEKITVLQRFAAKSELFREGRPSTGVFVVRSGRVKLSLHCSHGKSLVVEFAGPGEPLGLGATISARPYEVTAEATGPCEVAFLPRRRFLQFLADHPNVSMELVKLLCQDVDGAYERVRSLRQR